MLPTSQPARKSWRPPGRLYALLTAVALPPVAAGAVPFLIPDLLEPDEITLRRAVRRFASLGEVRDYLDQAARQARAAE